MLLIISAFLDWKCYLYHSILILKGQSRNRSLSGLNEIWPVPDPLHHFKPSNIKQIFVYCWTIIYLLLSLPVKICSLRCTCGTCNKYLKDLKQWMNITLIQQMYSINISWCNLCIILKIRRNGGKTWQGNRD